MTLHRKSRNYALYELAGPSEETDPVQLRFRQGDGLKASISIWPADFQAMIDRDGQPAPARDGNSGQEPLETLDGRFGNFSLLFRPAGERSWRTLDVLALDGQAWVSAPNINIQFNRSQVELMVRCTAATAPWAVEVSSR